MHPFLKILNFEVSSYGLFYCLAIIFVIIASIYFLTKRNTTLKIATAMVLSLAVAMLFGARLLHFITSFGSYPSWLNFFEFNLRNFSLFGGLIMAVFVGIVCARIFKLDLWRVGDTLAPIALVGIAIARVGCYLNGCCFGKVTTLSWGLRYPFMSDVHVYQLNAGLTSFFKVMPVHPTQFYETLAALIGALIAIYLIKKKAKDGLAILLATVWFSSFRLFNHFLRIDPPSYQAWEYFYPVLYGVVIVIALGFIFYRRNEK